MLLLGWLFFAAGLARCFCGFLLVAPCPACLTSSYCSVPAPLVTLVSQPVAVVYGAAVPPHSTNLAAPCAALWPLAFCFNLLQLIARHRPAVGWIKGALVRWRRHGRGEFSEAREDLAALQEVGTQTAEGEGEEEGYGDEF